MLEVILVGYPASQELVGVSKILVEKYIGVTPTYLNHEGPVNEWSKFVKSYLEGITNERIIFGLDDYLIEGCDKERLAEAILMEPCVKLCASTEEEHSEYPVTTQYTIWNRLELIDLLGKTTNPWDFEINGSKLFKGASILHTCLDYDVHSALSSRWEGVRYSPKILDECIEHLWTIPKSI